jgi:nitrate reductase (cytochrome), electron transfer subunit
MKIIRRMLVLLFCLSGLSQTVIAAVPLQGDGDAGAESLPAQIIPWMPESGPIARDYVQQPPLIPHKIEGYEVNIKVNKCLTCHSWANYQKAKATKISPTHFRDRDGIEMANVSPLRYFCTQCHVPQADAKPLVQNTFESVDILQPQ